MSIDSKTEKLLKAWLEFQLGEDGIQNISFFEADENIYVCYDKSCKMAFVLEFDGKAGFLERRDRLLERVIQLEAQVQTLEKDVVNIDEDYVPFTQVEHKIEEVLDEKFDFEEMIREQIRNMDTEEICDDVIAEIKSRL